MLSLFMYFIFGSIALVVNTRMGHAVSMEFKGFSTRIAVFLTYTIISTSAAFNWAAANHSYWTIAYFVIQESLIVLVILAVYWELRSRKFATFFNQK